MERRTTIIIFLIFSPLLIVGIIFISYHDFLDDGIHTGIITNPKFDTMSISGHVTSCKNYKGEIAIRLNTIHEQLRFSAFPNNSYSITLTGIGSWIEVSDSIYKPRLSDSIFLIKSNGKFSWRLHDFIR